ncbi:hypothetical protein BGZ70_008732 [Mortierella alpina]|uniref:Secreted protein n=1 Tax=Mortierella alpina TaxID=64518 RepID=A0A9P6J523_MORAP|nr:hypothetical protein BGZ70_008732 [Mortierella alpina]
MKTTTFLALGSLLVLQTCMAVTKVRCSDGSQKVSNDAILQLCNDVKAVHCQDSKGDYWCVHETSRNAHAMGNKCYKDKFWLVNVKSEAYPFPNACK